MREAMRALWVTAILLLAWINIIHACPDQCDCTPVKNKDSEGKSPGSKLVCQPEQPITNIEELELSELDQDVIYLDLSRNQITEIGNDVFAELTSLQRLNLSGNAISVLQPGAFNGLRNLQRLDLSANDLAAVNISIFTGLGKLERLYLGGNKLSYIAEGTFDSMPSLKRLDFASNLLHCDCKMSWLADWCQLRAIRIADSTRCQTPADLQGTVFRDLTVNDLHCDRPVEVEGFRLAPDRTQIVFQGDKLQFKCKVMLTEDDMTLTWLRQGQEVKPDRKEGLLVHLENLPDGSLQTNLVIEHLTMDDKGIWQCRVNTSAGRVAPLSVNIVVLDNSTIYCPEVVTPTNKGTFTWTKTMADTKPSIECPHEGAPSVVNSGRPLASYQCTTVGEWEELDTSQCAYQSEVTRALQMYAQKDFRNMTLQNLYDLLGTVEEYIGDPTVIQDKDDVIFMTRIIEHLMSQAQPASRLGTLVVELVSMTMDVKPSFLYAAQLQESSLSRMVKALEDLTPLLMLNKQAVNVYSKNIAMHATHVTKRDFTGIACTMFETEMEAIQTGNVELENVDGKQTEVTYGRDNFMCQMPQTENGENPQAIIDASPSTPRRVSASIQLPASLLANVRCLTAAGACQSDSEFVVHVIVYRHSALFPVNHTSGSWLRVDTPVISARVVETAIINTTEPIVLNLRADLNGYNRSAVYWDFKADGGFGRWVSHGCDVISEAGALTTAHCHHLTNFAVMQSEIPLSDGWVKRHWLAEAFTMSPFVYAGSFVLSMCAMATLITYLVCRSTLAMPKKLKHCVPNLCLGVLVLCLTFTFGIHTNEPQLLCHIIGIAIHYLSVCVLLWMAVTAYVMYKKFEKFSKPPAPRDPDAPITSKPVLGLYLIGWGLGLILCGIVAAINSLQHYQNENYCFLTPSAQIFAFYVPVVLLFIVNLALYLCICCTINSPTPNYLAPPHLDPETDDVNVTDLDLVEHTLADTTQPEASSIVAPTVTVATVAINQSALVNVSLNRSEPDLQYKPVNQLLGLVAILFLFLVTWACAALSVALPLKVYHQDIIFNCLYLFASSALGVFMLVFFVFARGDGRTSWHNACCCVKNDDYYDVNVASSSHERSALMNGGHVIRPSINGHLVHSASSLEGSNCTSNNTRRSNNQYRYAPVKQSAVSVVHSNPPTVTDSSFTVAQEYPNFINPKQNGIAKRYWRKQRLRNRIDRNKECYQRRLDVDSDTNENTRMSTEIQLQPQPYLRNNMGLQQATHFYQVTFAGDQGKMNGLRPPLMPTERYHFAPIVGISSPPGSSLLPPDGGSCVTSDRVSPIPAYDNYPPLPPPPSTIHTADPHAMPYISHSLPRSVNHAVNHAVGPITNHVNAYMQRNGSIPRLRDFDGKSSTSRDTRDTRALSIGSDSQVQSFKQNTNKGNDKARPLEVDERLVPFRRQSSNTSGKTDGKGVVYKVPPVPPKRYTNTSLGRDKGAHDLSGKKGTEMVTFTSRAHPGQIKSPTQYSTSQFSNNQSHLGFQKETSPLPVSGHLYGNRAPVRIDDQSAARVPLLANVHVNSNSNNSSAHAFMHSPVSPNSMGTTLTDTSLNGVRESSKSPVSQTQLSPSGHHSSSLKTNQSQTQTAKNVSHPNEFSPFSTKIGVAHKTLNPANDGENHVNSSIIENQAITPVIKHKVLDHNKSDLSQEMENDPKTKDSLDHKQSTLPYAYVNHSYQEKVMRDLLQSSECAALLAEDKGPNWMPRSVSGYDRIAGHVSTDEGADWSTESGDVDNKDVDSTGNDDVWIPRKQRRRRKLSNKETCV